MVPGDDPTPITSISLEIDIASAATGPLFTVTAQTTPSRFAGLIKVVKNFNYTPSSSGEYDIVDLPKGPLINRITMQSADVNRVKVSRDDTDVFDRTKALNAVLQGDGNRVPDSDWFVVDPTEKGNGSDSIITAGAQSFTVKMYMDAGGAVPVMVEYLDAVQV